MNLTILQKVKRFSQLLLSLLLVSNGLFAQFTQYDIPKTGSSGFDRFLNVVYDPFVEGRIYGANGEYTWWGEDFINGRQIFVSEDHGGSWRLLYTFPEGVYDGYIKHLNFKLSKDAKHLYFAFGNINISDAELKGVHSLNVATKEVRQYPIPNIEDMATISSFDVYGNTGDTMIIHTSFLNYSTWAPETKVYYTQNGGSTWKMVYYSHWEESQFVHVNDVVISPNNPEKLFILRSLGPTDIDGGLLISTDGGNNWTESLAGFALSAIAFHPNNPNEILVGTSIRGGALYEAVFRSTDGGTTWLEVNMPPWQDWIQDNIWQIQYDPTDPNKIVVVEENERLFSDDGGATWFRRPNPTSDFQLSAQIDPFNSDRMFAIEDQKTYYTTNRCQDYSLMYFPTPAISYVSPSVSVGKNNDVSYLYYIRDDKFYRNNLNTNASSNYAANGCDGIIADATMGMRAFLTNSATKKIYYVNESNTLNQVSGTAENVKTLTRDPNNASMYWIAMNGSVTKVDVSSVSNITTTVMTTPATGNVTGIFISPSNSNEVYIAKGNKVYKSTNGGTSWNEKSSGLGSDLITNMVVNPLNTSEFLLAAGDKLYRSVNASESWSVSLSGYAADKASFSPQINGLMVAANNHSAGHYSDIVYSKDHGVTWKKMGTDKLRNAVITEMDFYFDNNFVTAYAATSDMGRISYKFDTDAASVCNPPQNFRLYMLGGCSAKLEWSAPDGNPNAKYNIYRDNVKIVSEIAATTYTDNDFAEGEHNWCIKAVCGTEESESACRTGSCVSYRPPQDLIVSMNNIIGVGDCSVDLSWNAPSGIGNLVSYYKVYRDNVLLQSNITSPAFTDNDFETGSHEWCVSAVYGSHESEKLCGTASCVLVCEAPRDLQVITTYYDGFIADLSWTHPEGYPTATYNVYRDGVKIAENLTQTSFNDLAASQGGHEWGVTTNCQSDTESEPATIKGYCSECTIVTDFTVETNFTNGQTSAALSWDITRGNRDAVTIFHEGFEGGIPSAWKNMDKDGDGHQWVANFDEPYIYDQFFSRCVGEYVYSLREYIDPSDWDTHKLSPDNWLITPAIHLTTGNATLKFFAALVNPNNPLAYYEVYISTNGTNYEDFTLLYSERITAYGDVWYERNIQLEGYTGDVYFAFRNLNDAEEWTSGIRLDEVSVTEEPFKYNIYRDNILIAEGIEGTSYEDTGFATGYHDWCVKKLCAFGESDMACEDDVYCGPPLYTITASAAENGAISPEGAVVVVHGTNQTFSITPNFGYAIDQVLVDGVNNPEAVNNNAYTFVNVTGAHTIHVTFKVAEYSITATAGAGGGITPAGVIGVSHGDSRTFNITSLAGYNVVLVLIDGVNNEAAVANKTYTFENITANHTISVSFQLYGHVITSSAGAGGSIKPEGMTVVNHGQAQFYSFTPEAGYKVSQVLVDGANNQEAVGHGMYTFSNVTSAHEIHVDFELKSLVINASATTGGVISPNGAVQVVYGESQTFTFAADANYTLTQVLIDGVNNPAAVESGSYTFNNVTAAHGIQAVFIAKSYEITATAGAGGKISPEGTATVAHGGEKTYKISPNTGFEISKVLIDGENNESAIESGTFKFSNISDNHTIEAEFSPIVFTITASVDGGNGEISPAGEIEISYGETPVFTFTPAKGYKIAAVLVDGEGKPTAVNIGNYTFAPVVADHSIVVSFEEIVVSIDDMGTSSLTLYPNPTAGALKIENGKLKMNCVRVFDMTGRLVQEVNRVDNSEVILDISALSNGIYFIDVDGKTMKVVKQ